MSEQLMEHVLTQERQNRRVSDLAEWEQRLLLRASQLRASGKSVMLFVKFDGPAMTLWRVTPDGRVE